MVEVQIAYEGQLRCQATHMPSGVTLSTDAPLDNQGRGESFSPTDLVAVALGTCMLTIMGIVARRHEWDLSGTRVRVEKHMVTAPVRRIGRLPVEITVPVKLSAEQQQMLERAALTCPVHHSLHPDIESPVTFRWTA
jgi:putative redox protein